MRNAREIKIGDAIKLMLRKYKLEGQHNSYLVGKAWKKVMGNMINNKTNNIYMRGETLYISVTSITLKKELGFGKSKIIDMINEEIGKKIISNVELI